jgi:predicted glycogen debranching enzyme
MTAKIYSSSSPPIVLPYRADQLDKALSREWVLPNKIGAYASSTILGCNTRRYHGLLIAAATPPVCRIAAISTVMEQFIIGSDIHELAINEFADAFSPRGMDYLVEFVQDSAPSYLYRFGKSELVKEIILAEAANAVAVRYTYRGPNAVLRLWPFVALRDYHFLRKVHQPHQMTFENIEKGRICIQDRLGAGHGLYAGVNGCSFEPRPQWWYRFLYRGDVARGQDGLEDLYTPGCFTGDISDGHVFQFTASLDEPLAVDFDAAAQSRRGRLQDLAESVGHDADETTRRLAMATDAFVVQRSFPNAPSRATVLAGFHWFADWGRDAFIALPGLLLSTRRFDLARQVFRTFADHISDGMIPNRFDDYSAAAHYNSIDASLWFIIAADRFVAATGDTTFWRDVLMPASEAILTAYRNGTRFDIHADADGLLAGGSASTQLTWMDAKLGDGAITPRHGKAVEINALWHCAHRIMAERCAKFDSSRSHHYTHLAELISPAFVRSFWNEAQGCLYDCVTDGHPDATIRPNQIFAVSLPYSPLLPQQQSAVVHTVCRHLLTPLGLRSLSPDDSRYRRAYGISWESRDRAYHQGCVWAWLIGPMVEAYLKTEPNRFFACKTAAEWLKAFDSHLSEAGVGFISEIFDGDAPHAPHGCIAQAWSVAEVLRAKILVNLCVKGGRIA